MSPDLEDDNTKHQVENLREALNGDDKPLIATLQQLNDTSGVRHKIEEAVKSDKYTSGAAVPGDINLRLNARKNSNQLDSLNMGNVKEQDEIDNEKGKPVIKPFWKAELPIWNENSDHVHPYFWIRHRLPTEEKPMFLRQPTAIETLLSIPIWKKLRHDFMRNYIASKKN